jgi:hypothetical protein
MAENQTILKFGEGKVAVTGGVQVPDENTVIALMFLEQDKGAGSVGASVPERPGGSLVWPEQVNGVILEFSNPKSVDVVIEQLRAMRQQFGAVLTNDDLRQEYLAKSEAAIAA